MRVGMALGVLAWSVAGCGGAAPRPTAAPEATAPEPPSPPAIEASASAELVIDGVRDGRVLDERDGLRLVGGAGTVALVGPDGHVRAAHRFGYGGAGAVARFLDERRAIVGDADVDGFRGPWSGRLVRWDLDADTLEQLAELGYDVPTMGHLGDRLLVGLEGGVRVVTEAGLAADALSDASRVLCLESLESGDTCFFFDDRLREAVRLDASGALVHVPVPEGLVVVGTSGFAVDDETGRSLVRLSDLSPVAVELADDERMVAPYGEDDILDVYVGYDRVRRLALPSLTPLPDGARVEHASPVAARGALGLPTLAFAHASSRLALGSSAGVVVLGPGGFEHTRALVGDVRWSTEAVLGIGRALAPLDLPVIDRISTRTDEVPYGFSDEESDVPSEADPIQAWQDGGPMPEFPPLCNEEAPRRCVRTVLDAALRDGVARLEVYDPARPTRVITRIALDLPATPQTVAVTGHRVRVVDLNGRMRVEAIGAGETSPTAEPSEWRETARGWVLIDGEDPSELVGVPAGSGALVRRSMGEGASIDVLTIVDDERIVVGVDGVVHLLRIPTLETLATYPASERVRWHCELDDVVEGETDTRIEGACPRPVPEDDYRTIPALLSADRAFWAEPLGDEVRVHRVVDGASITVRMTTEGTLVLGPGPTFEASGTTADHLVLREAGPVRSAAITTGADVRARCERPGLVAAFFSGAPLP